MENIKRCTAALIDAILESDEYTRFCELRDQVREQPELRAQINSFRQHVFEVQNSREPLDTVSYTHLTLPTILLV